MRQQFGLGLHGLRKLRLQHLRNTLVVLLPGALEERLIGGLLDQRMLEDIRRLRWQPLLVQELRLHQLVQPALDGRLIPRRDGPQQLIGKFAPNVAPSCARPFTVARRSNRAISESCRVAGMASGGRGLVSS